MLATGETYVNTPYKARAENYEEMWNFIIEDLEAAAGLLGWKPYNNQYGRCTKGMALAYLGDAYMWKAYRVPDKATECYKSAESGSKTLDCTGLTAALEALSNAVMLSPIDIHASPQAHAVAARSADRVFQ